MSSASPPHAGQAGWDRRIVVEHFWFLYEKDYIDPDGSGFLVKKYLADTRADFGDIDAVCLWQSYPRLGLDSATSSTTTATSRAGMTELVRDRALPAAVGVRVFLNYNPWDTGTRREPRTDAETLARFLEATGADGIFLDTIEAADRACWTRCAACGRTWPSAPSSSRPCRTWRTSAAAGSSSPCRCRPLVLAHRWLDPRLLPPADRPLRAGSHAQEVCRRLPPRHRSRGVGERVRLVEPVE